MAESIPCDVVILPDVNLANAAIKSSQALKQHGGLFILEDGKFYPHSSLYMFQLKNDALENVKELLADIASRYTKLELKATQFDHTLGFVDAEYARTAELDNLQLEVITALNPIRDGMREKDKARMQDATGLSLQNFERYGYKYVGELFRPHLTLSRLSDQQPESLTALGECELYNGNFTKLGLFEMGDNGTCIRKISEWQLKI